MKICTIVKGGEISYRGHTAPLTSYSEVKYVLLEAKNISRNITRRSDSVQNPYSKWSSCAPMGGSRKFRQGAHFFCHQRFYGPVSGSWALGLIASRGLSVPEILRKPIATCDFPGAGVQTSYSASGRPWHQRFGSNLLLVWLQGYL